MRRRIGLLTSALLSTGLCVTPVLAQAWSRETLRLESTVFANTRSLRVLLPPSYGQARDRRYPVFYFLDGVAAWDAWGVPDVVELLWQEGEIPEYIFVSIDNGGSTLETADPVRDRASEYLPYPDPSWTEAPPVPRGDRFPAFLLDEVMARVDHEYRTAPEGASTGLAGDSYAGAAALYTAMRHPDRIGLLLVESPSLHVGAGRLLREAAAASRWPRRVYLGVGTAEGDTPEAQAGMVVTVRELANTLEVHPSAPEVLLVVREGADHWYDAWRERLPKALRFLLAAKPQG